ncbi:MAG: glycosyltransferase family 39 protein [bacterium]
MESSKKGFGIFIDRLNKMKCWQILSILFIVNLLLRLFLQHFFKETGIYHDTADYLNLAYNLYTGKGYVNDVWWAMFLKPEQLPRLETLRAPLLPFLLSIIYWLVGVNFFAAKTICIISGSLIPIFTYLISHLLYQSKPVSLLTAILVSVNNLLFHCSIAILTDIPFALLILITFWFLLRGLESYKIHNFILCGVFLGLSYLMRAQGALFVPVVLISLIIKFRIRKSIKPFFYILVCSFLVISPYLYRNWVITGNPLYSTLQRLALQGYFGDMEFFWHSVTSPPGFIPFIISHPLKTMNHTIQLFWDIYSQTPECIFIDPILFVFFIIGILITLSQWRIYLPIYLYIIILHCFLSLTSYEWRYFSSIIPFYLLFTSLGFRYLYLEMNWEGKRYIKYALLVLITIPILTNLVTSMANSFKSGDSYFEQSLSVSNFLKKNTKPNEAIMAGVKPYYYTYCTKRQTISFPFCDESTFQSILREYNVKYIALSQNELMYFRKEWLLVKSPENIKLVYKNKKTDTLVFEVLKSTTPGSMR